MRKGFLTILAILAGALIGCGEGADSTASDLPARNVSQMTLDKHGLVGREPKPKIPKGQPPKSLVVEDLIEGDGPVAHEGDVVTIQYVGADYKTGKNYDSSWEWTHPYVFKIGAEEVMKGLEQGVKGMAVGDRRGLVIPPALANPDGSRSGIPENETVVYVVDLLNVE